MIIDLNCDLGESDEAIRAGLDEALLEIVSSANIACGGHAGSHWSMEQTLSAAKRHGVAAGAHPGYPDREHFGRRTLALSEAAIEDAVAAQLEAIAAIASRLAVPLVHVKPHGALYNTAAQDLAVARAIGAAVLRWNPFAAVVGLRGSRMLEVWRAQGLNAVAEVFADRAYEPDGSLRSRALPGALLTAPADAAAQALRLAEGGAETICVHGDTPGAVEIARSVRQTLEASGWTVRSRCTMEA